MPSRLARGLALTLLLTAATGLSARQPDKKAKHRFNGKTIAEWAADLASKEVRQRRMAAYALEQAGPA